MSDRKTEFIEDELEYLWSSLWWAERRSLSSDPLTPSMEMESIMSRIVKATSIVGPVSWESISVEAIRSRRYEHWAEYMGVEYQMPLKERLCDENY